MTWTMLVCLRLVTLQLATQCENVDADKEEGTAQETQFVAPRDSDPNEPASSAIIRCATSKCAALMQETVRNENGEFVGVAFPRHKAFLILPRKGIFEALLAEYVTWAPLLDRIP